MAWFYARAGPAPTALSLIEWLHGSGATYDATTFGRIGKGDSDCEWNLMLPPVVGRHTIRSPLVVAAALDTASLWLSSFDAKDHASRPCATVRGDALRSMPEGGGPPCSRITGRALEFSGLEAFCRRL